MTAIDGYKEAGKSNYCVIIPEDSIGSDAEFVGDVGRPNGLFSQLKKQSSKTMKLLNGKTTRGSVTGAAKGKAPILVTRSIFEALEKEYLTDYSHLPETLYYHLNDEYCAKLGCIGNEMVEGVLKWKGHLVILMEDWDAFYDLVGIEAHIAIMAIPGVFGMAFDVPALDQFGGLGMIIEQKLSAPDLGKIYMHTNFDIGMGIANPDLITYAGIYLPKEA
jgi:hypothetical protein